MNSRYIDTLSALSHLLEQDLERVTYEQEEAARRTIHVKPSNWELILAMKRWAAALAGTCRSYAAKCAVIHADYEEKEPAIATMKTLMLALCRHLGLPDRILFDGEWPESNRLRSFVLYVSDAPLDLINDEPAAKPILPRWHTESGFSRILKVPGLKSDSSTEKGSCAFLSFEETRYVLRGLEESFRNALWSGLYASYNEAALATYKDPVTSAHADTAKSSNLRYRSPLKRAIAMGLIKHKLTDREICDWLDEEGAADLPGAWMRGNDRSFLSVYRDPDRRHKVESIINKVRTDMRRTGLL